MISSLDTFFCLNAAADFYVNLDILVIEMRRDTNVFIQKNEVAEIALMLCKKKLLKRLKYQVETQTYIDSTSESDINDKDWFEITAEGRIELDRLYIDNTEKTAEQGAAANP